MQKLEMQKTDFADFTSRVKLLLELMTNNPVEETTGTQAESKRSSPDVSDSEDDDSDEDLEDSKEPKENVKNESNRDKVVRLENFFNENVDQKRKVPPSSSASSIWDMYKFEEKMYRVIPVRLDRRRENSRQPLKRKVTWQN